MFFPVEFSEATKVDEELFDDNACDIVPLFVLKVLTDSYYKLVVPVGKSAVNNQMLWSFMFLYLVVLQVPHLDITFGQCH